jgi:VanZ family protein
MRGMMTASYAAPMSWSSAPGATLGRPTPRLTAKRPDAYRLGMTMSMRTRSLTWLPVLAWAGLIFYLSAQPNLRFEQDATLDFIVRKAGHMGVFGVLALLLWWALSATMRLRPAPAIAWAGALALAYAATDEVHQGFTAGRHPALTDVGIDGIGIVVVLLVGLAGIRRRQRAR